MDAALPAHGGKVDADELDEPQNAPVIIAGFGRYGQIVGRMLFANGVQPTVLDHDAEQIEAMRRFGWRVFYGDATRLDLLRTAGADKARVLVRRDRRHRAEHRLREDGARALPATHDRRAGAQRRSTTTSCASAA